MQPRLTPESAKAALAALDTAPFIELLTHGSLIVEFYQPRGTDAQRPHTRDEIYVVVAGTGTFLCGDDRQPIGPGEVLFVPAGIAHRFEDFSFDFSTWVFFYGPEGGEQ